MPRQMRTVPFIHRVDIEQPNPVQDAYGRRSYVAFRSDVPARVCELSGAERASAQAVVDQVSHLVYLRGDPPDPSGGQQVRAKMRIRFLTKMLEIHEVLNPDGRGFQLEVYCVQVANA